MIRTGAGHRLVGEAWAAAGALVPLSGTARASDRPNYRGPNRDGISAEGDPASFTVAATGTGTLSYQWYEDGSQVAGATAATYAISSTTLSQNGHKFRWVVTDSGGTAMSSQATLTVNAPVVDTDGDGVLDPNEDPDDDGHTNLREYQSGTNPNVSDRKTTTGACTGGGPGAGSPAGAPSGGDLHVDLQGAAQRREDHPTHSLRASNRRMVGATGVSFLPDA